jgi:hypothetical protein
MGFLIPLGWDREKFIDEEAFRLNYNNYSRTRTSITYGGEAFIGVQAFVADLPLALGIDFGVAAMGHLFDRYKHEVSTKVGSLTSEQVYYTVDDTGAGIAYESLNRRDFQLQGNIRVTFAYFFKK